MQKIHICSRTNGHINSFVIAYIQPLSHHNHIENQNGPMAQRCATSCSWCQIAATIAANAQRYAGKYHTKPSIWTKIVYAISICPFIQIFLCFMIFLWFGSPRHDMWYSISTILTAISKHFERSTFNGCFNPIYVYTQSKELNFKSLIFRHWFSICQFRDSFFNSYYLFNENP